MNKEEFNKLSIDIQVREFNKFLSEGSSINKTCKQIIKIAPSTIKDRFKAHGFKYNKDQNQYIYDNSTTSTQTEKMNDKADNKSENIEVINHDSVTVVEEIKHDKVTSVKEKNGNALVDYKKDITDIVNVKEKLFEIIEWYEENKSIKQLIIPGDLMAGESITRSFKVDEKILKEFLIYCDKNKQYTQKQILSYALYRLMEDYQK